MAKKPLKGDFRAILKEEGGDVDLVAARFDTSVTNVNRWVRQWKLEDERDSMRKARVERLMQSAGGNISEMARKAKVSRQTIYDWLKKWDLKPPIEEERDSLYEDAVSNLRTAVTAGDLDISRFVVTHIPPGPNRQRWSSKQEISATVVGIPLSEELLQKLALVGYTPEMVAAELENLLSESLENDSPDVGD